MSSVSPALDPSSESTAHSHRVRDPFGSSTFILYSTIQGKDSCYITTGWILTIQFILAYSRMHSYSFDLKLCESGAAVHHGEFLQ